MRDARLALVCMLGVAACGGEERPMQARMSTTTLTSQSETVARPSPAPTAPSASTAPTELTHPRTGTPPPTSGNAAATGAAGATGLPEPAPATSLAPPDTVDHEVSARVRRSVTSDETLSPAAKSIKIVTVGGRVTLSGQVKSERERSAVETKAKTTPGVSSVDNQLEVER